MSAIGRYVVRILSPIGRLIGWLIDRTPVAKNSRERGRPRHPSRYDLIDWGCDPTTLSASTRLIIQAARKGGKR
jgi:hypothetical protein